MKKILIIAIFGLLIGPNTFAGINSYSATQSNTRPWGCAWIDFSSEPNIAGGTNFNIRCVDPGEMVCQHSDGTCPLIVSNTILQIQDAIYNQSIMSGDVVTPWGAYRWEATDIFNFEYTVDVNF